MSLREGGGGRGGCWEYRCGSHRVQEDAAVKWSFPPHLFTPLSPPTSSTSLNQHGSRHTANSQEPASRAVHQDHLRPLQDLCRVPPANNHSPLRLQPRVRSMRADVDHQTGGAGCEQREAGSGEEEDWNRCVSHSFSSLLAYEEC
jgi:hypothetical protein